MELKIKNIGKIKEGNVKLEGITIISGKGDAGKTTVLKILSTVLDVLNFSDDSVNFSCEQNKIENKEEIIQKDVQEKFENNFGKMINNFFSNDKGLAEIIIEDETEKPEILKISIKENLVETEENDVKTKIENIFIDNPADLKNTNVDNLLKKNAGYNEKKIDYKKFKRLNEIVKGRFEILDPVEYELGEYGYKIPDEKENESNAKTIIPLKNLSHSLKKLAFLKMIMEKQLLKENDVLIIDNAEDGLHPEMQLIFGETVVLMQKEFGIKVILTTQSPFLLDAIEVFSEKYGIGDKMHYYLAEDGNIKNVDDETRQIYKEMVKPIQELENIKYE